MKLDERWFPSHFMLFQKKNIITKILISCFLRVLCYFKNLSKKYSVGGGCFFVISCFVRVNKTK